MGRKELCAAMSEGQDFVEMGYTRDIHEPVLKRERDFHAEAIALVTKERSEWAQKYLEGSVPFLSDLDCLKNECESGLRGDDLLRQMLGVLNSYPKFGEICASCPHGEEPDYCVCCETDYGKAVLAWKQKRDEQIAAAEKYLEVK